MLVEARTKANAKLEEYDAKFNAIKGRG